MTFKSTMDFFRGALISLFLIVKADAFLRFLNRRKVLIVMYHGIISSDLPIPCWWQLPLRDFEEQIYFLKNNYCILSLKDVITKIKSNERLPNNVAVITFDDGFENNYSLAYPILNKFNLPATVFLTTGYVGTQNLLWPDKLYIEILETKKSSLNLTGIGLENYDLRTLDSKKVTFECLVEELKLIDPKRKNKILLTIGEMLDVDVNRSKYFNDFKLLSLEQITNFQDQNLIDFGAHTVNHEILSRLDDLALKEEIVTSCSFVKKLNQVVSFAYPNGRDMDYDNRAIEHLKSLDVNCALTTKNGLNDTASDIFKLRRIAIGSATSIKKFNLSCSGL